MLGFGIHQNRTRREDQVKRAAKVSLYDFLRNLTLQHTYVYPPTFSYTHFRIYTLADIRLPIVLYEDSPLGIGWLKRASHD